MRGHEALLALRRRGQRPLMADICDGMDGLACWRDWPNWSGAAHIEVRPEDRINRLDLRCIVGMFVSVGGMDANRVRQLHDRCVEVGASGVMAAVYAVGPHGTLQAVERIETMPCKSRATT